MLFKCFWYNIGSEHGAKSKNGFTIWPKKDCYLGRNLKLLHHNQNKFFKLRILGMRSAILLYLLQEICITW